MNTGNLFSLRRKIGVFLVLIIVGMLTTTHKVGGWNDASRMATVQSLVEHHTFQIDQSVFVRTGDKVLVNGHFYSDKPVGPSVMGALVYWPLYHLGITLDYGRNAAYYLITLFVVKGFWLLGLLVFYKALSLTSLDAKRSFYLTAALGVASLYFTWASTFNNHILAASQLMIGFYFLLKARLAASVRLNLFYAGFFLSLAGAVDMPTGTIYVGFLAYVLMNEKLRRDVRFYVIPLVLTVIPSLVINYQISGSIMPLQLNEAYFIYPGSPWLQSNELSGMGVNDGVFFLQYSFKALFGARGFLLYNSFLLLALPYLFLEIKRKRMFMHEAAVIGGASIIIVLYYLLFTNNYSGDSYSIRWFVPLLPLLFFFMHPFLEGFTTKRRWVFVIIFVLSTTIATVGAFNPWSRTRFSDTPLLSNIIELRMLLER